MVRGHPVAKVEVVIPTHNRREVALACLEELGRVSRRGLHVHVIVIDDGSTDGTNDAIHRMFKDVEIVVGDGNLWYTGATNLGMQTALARNPDYILAMNDDTFLEETCLEQLVLCGESHGHCVVGPLLLDGSQPLCVFGVDPHWDTWYGGWRHRRKLRVDAVPRSAWEVELIVGNCVLFPTQAIRENGLMDAAAFPQYGDAEYTPRLRRAGWQLLVEPSARARCQPNTVPPPLRSLPWCGALRELVVRRESGYNLAHVFWTGWHAAPSRVQGVLAFVVYLCRLTLKMVGIGGSWPFWPDPPTKVV